MANSTAQTPVALNPAADPGPIGAPRQPAEDHQAWTKGICPNCSYANADVDPEGVTWCPACGYSRKGCYT